MEGNIMVNEVLASCYPTIDHDLAQFAMTPIRWFPEVIEWIFGYYNGSPAYVKIAQTFGRLLLPFRWPNDRNNFWEKVN